jgi:hypothetical protein
MYTADWKLLDTTGSTVEQKKEILKYASEIRKFEIERFWGRSLFFWGFIASAFVAYAYTYKSQPEAQLEFVRLVIAGFGFVASFAWTLQNRGSKYWQEAWEQKVESVEAAVLGTNLFSNREPMLPKGFFGAADFSVSRLAIVFSDFTVVVWGLLALQVAFSSSSPSEANWLLICFLAMIVAVVLVMLFCSSSKEAEICRKIKRYFLGGKSRA